jgi:hypothetical protein
MKLSPRVLITVWLTTIAIFHLATAQDVAEKKSMNEWMGFKGYLKDLQTASLPASDSLYLYGLLHNRLNFKFNFSSSFTGAIEFRNRLYYGQLTQFDPEFGNQIAQDNGYFNLSKLWVNENSIVLHTIIDRVWLDWSHQKWEIRAGRQRINWGKSLIWNPNDLFNTFNYADFDYEEQPGSDALKLTYYPSGMSALEMVVAPGKHKDETVAAGAWRFNQHNYDMQLLGGLYYTDIAFGFGWAGNIRNAGFKGEATWFQPKDHFTDTTGILSATISVDYSFKKPVYVQGGLLYNHHPGTDSISYSGSPIVLNESLSAKNLMPSEWSFFEEISNQFTPLWRADLAVIEGVDPGFVFVMPSITYSISDNWDLMLLDQSVWAIGQVNNYTFSSLYMRLKWSF